MQSHFHDFRSIIIIIINWMQMNTEALLKNFQILFQNWTGVTCKPHSPKSQILNSTVNHNKYKYNYRNIPIECKGVSFTISDFIHVTFLAFYKAIDANYTYIIAQRTKKMAQKRSMITNFFAHLLMSHHAPFCIGCSMFNVHKTMRTKWEREK